MNLQLPVPGRSWREITHSLDALVATSSPDALSACARSLLERLDGRLLFLATLSLADPAQPMRLGAGVYPGDWRTRYETAGLGSCDPVATAARSGRRPFLLQEALAAAPMEHRVRRHYEDASAGFGTVHPQRPDASGELGLVVVAGATPVADPELHVQRRLLASAFGEEARALLSRPAPSVSLTPRQLSCLRAAARGHNSIQIGAELGLAPKTVDTYLAAAAVRLGALNRIAACTQAMRLGLI